RGPVAGDHRLQHRTPTLGGVDVAGPQGAAFEITKLVEHEQRMIAGAAEVPVVSGPFRQCPKFRVWGRAVAPVQAMARVKRSPQARRQLGAMAAYLRPQGPASKALRAASAAVASTAR